MHEFLDLHLLFPVLEFESAAPAERLELLKRTKKFDLRASLYQKVHAKKDASAEKDRSSIQKELQQLQSEAADILKVLEDPSVAEQLSSDRVANVQLVLSHNTAYTEAMLQPVYNLAMHHYQCGAYSTCSNLLKPVRLLVSGSST